MRVGIVTDSTCDLPSATLLRAGIAAVPLKVFVGDDTYLDWRNIEPLTLYEWMSDDGVLPTTSPPDIEDFIPVYERYLTAYDEIVSIHLSSKLSETMHHAQQAAMQLGATDRIHFVDSEYATAAMAEVVMAAVETAQHGTVQQVIAAAETVREEFYALICPASLHWLVAGGRLSRTKGVIGNLLGIRPVLTIKEGQIDRDGNTRQNVIVETLVEKIADRFGQTPINIVLGFAGKDRSEIEMVKAALHQAGLNVAKGRIQLVGPVIGAHLGPGTILMGAYPAAGARS